MAGRGPAGKAQHTRTRNDPNFTNLVADGTLYGQPLPDDVLPWDAENGAYEEWHPQTVRWWNSIRSFPLLADEPDLGWQFLVDTALMHHTMWRKGKWEFAAELRLRMAKYGATPEDRMRLKITVQAPAPGEVEQSSAAPGAASVTSIVSRRSRLMGDA